MGVATSTGRGSGARIEVDPDVLIRSGQRLGSLGSQLAMLSDSLGAALSSGIASGWDPAGLNFGIAYGDQAQQFADALADGANALKSGGRLLEATGYNYKNADAVSTIGGSGPSGGVSGEPSKTTAGDAASGPNSIFVPPPAMWYLVAPFLGLAMAWPLGNPSMLRVTAAQWRNIGHGISVFEDEMAVAKTAVSVQHIPEGASIASALGKLGQRVSDLSDAASTVARSVEDFATTVQNTQDAIRRLLDRLSPEGLFDTVKGFLTGDGEKILRELAHDVDALLDNFQNQVKGVVGLLGQLTKLIGDAADEFQKWIRPVLVAQFGDQVGGALADAVTGYTDFEVGLANGLIGTVSGLVSLADADTWKGMAELAASVAEDPTKLPGVLENMGKQFVAWDQFSGDHPGRAVGEAAFNIGSLFVPGGALTKTGNVAKGFKFTKGLFEDGKLGPLSKVSELGSGSHKLEELGDLGGAGSKVPEVPEFKPAPGVPDSIVNPKAPDPIDAPPSPHGLEGPAGPPDPPGSTGTPGGDHHGGGGGDGPPDPPGRSTGPSDSGPGPTAHSPGPSSVDSQHGSEPPAASHAPSPSETPPPAAAHAPESSSPASPHDAGHSPSEPSPTTHGSSAPEVRGDGHLGEQSGGGSPGDVAAQHDSGSHEHTAPPDERAGAPTDHQPAHTAPGDEPGTHERSSTDGDQTREHSQTVGAGEERRHEPAAATQPAVASGGMPMAPHAGGGVHGSDPAPGRTPTSGASPRPPDSKTPSASSPETPRAQAPSAAGPAPGNAPTAPVDKAPLHPASGGQPSREPRRGSEPPSGPATDRAPESSTGDERPTNAARPHSPEHVPGGSQEPPIPREAPHDSKATEHGPPEGSEAAAEHVGNSAVHESARQDPIRSHDPTGEGWQRRDDVFEHDGGHHPLDQHWTYGDYPDVCPAIRDLISDPEAPWGRDADGEPMTQHQHEETYNKLGPNDDHWQVWPPNAGAAAGTRVVYDDLEAFNRDFGIHGQGVSVDRIGKLDGDYMAVMHDGTPASYEQRSLPVYNLTQPYSQYMLSGVLPRGWQIEVSEVAPWFGRPGGGIQVLVLDGDGAAVTIPELRERGILR